jgi:hypothetical protein
MKDDSESKSVIHAALEAARADLKRGDPNGAQRHLDVAAQYGAPESQTRGIATAIERIRITQVTRRGSGGWRGFWVAVLGYALISFQQPLGWGLALWGFLAFLLTPSLAGVVIGLYQRTAGTPSQSFWTAFKSVSKVMAFYTALHLILIGGPHSDKADAGQEFLAGLLSTIVFALIAGLVAGAVGAMIVGVRTKEQRA